MAQGASHGGKTYWENLTTGEVVEYWKDPGKSGQFDYSVRGWGPAPKAYIDKLKQRDRETGGIAELRKAIALFDEDYGKGMEARARASASSAAVTSGLGGTTRPGAVSAGLMAEFEDVRRGRLAGAQTNLAQFLGSYRDPYGVTPQVQLGQQQLTQQGQQAGRQLDFSYAQLGQQGRQFEAELGLGYAGLNARRNQPTPTAPAPTVSAGRSIWNPPPDDSFSDSGNVRTGNLLGDFDPEAANLRLGNVATGF